MPSSVFHGCSRRQRGEGPALRNPQAPLCFSQESANGAFSLGNREEKEEEEVLFGSLLKASPSRSSLAPSWRAGQLESPSGGWGCAGQSFQRWSRPWLTLRDSS